MFRTFSFLILFSLLLITLPRESQSAVREISEQGLRTIEALGKEWGPFVAFHPELTPKQLSDELDSMAGVALMVAYDVERVRAVVDLDLKKFQLKEAKVIFENRRVGLVGKRWIHFVFTDKQGGKPRNYFLPDAPPINTGAEINFGSASLKALERVLDYVVNEKTDDTAVLTEVYSWARVFVAFAKDLKAWGEFAKDLARSETLSKGTVEVGPAEPDARLVRRVDILLTTAKSARYKIAQQSNGKATVTYTNR